MNQMFDEMGITIPSLNEGLAFTVEGKPIGKGRPRVTRNGTYTPRKTREYERLISWTFKSKYPKHKPFEGPVFMTVIAYMPIPKSYPKYKKKEMAKETVLHTKSPDWDNIGKVVCDALNGLAWVDDKQVMGRVIKLYSPRPRIDVYIRGVEEE